MHNAVATITAYVLERLDGEPVNKRVRIYRALAEVAIPDDAKRFLALANECEAVDVAHQQLAFDFLCRSRKIPESTGKPGNGGTAE